MDADQEQSIVSFLLYCEEAHDKKYIFLLFRCLHIGLLLFCGIGKKHMNRIV